MTPVPIHTVVPSPAPSPSQADPTAPRQPGSPQSGPNAPGNQNGPQQDSLDDIRADLDHYPGGLSPPDPADQQALLDAVPRNEDGTPQRFPDPYGTWAQLQNDGGNTVPGRSNNCADNSRAFLETWYGNPQVAAPRTPDTDENGNPDLWSPEDNANDNQIRATGAAHSYAGPGGDPATANNIASVLQQAGPGSAAIVQVDWPGGGGHAFNVVNHNGNIIWIDTQSGDVSDQPLHIDQAEHVWQIPLDANRNPIDLSQPAATDTGQAQQQSSDSSGHKMPESDSQPENTRKPQNGDTSAEGPTPGTNTPPPGNPSPSTDAPNPTASNGTHPAPSSRSEPDTAPQGDTTTESGRPRSPDAGTVDPSNASTGRDSAPVASDGSPSSRDDAADPQQRPQPSPDPAPEQSSTSTAEADGQTSPQSLREPTDLTDLTDLTGNEGLTQDRNSEQPTRTAGLLDTVDSPADQQKPPLHSSAQGNSTQSSVDTSQSSASPSESQRTTGADGSTRRGPAEPTGSEQKENNQPKKPKKTAAEKAAEVAKAREVANTPLDSSRPEGAPGYGVVQTGDNASVHHDMLGDESQNLVRVTNDVVQTDLHAIAQQLNQWADGNPSPLLLTIQEAAQHGSLTQDRLNQLLKPGFAEMSREDKAATVAAIARLSSSFHDAHAVQNSGGADLHSRHQATRGDQLDPAPLARRYAATQDLADQKGNEPEEGGQDSDGNQQEPSEKEVRTERAKFNKLWNREVGDSQLKRDIEKAESEGKPQSEIDALREQRRMMRPDFSGKNFAALEVVERRPDGTTEVRYLIDSSNPPLDHSEPVLGEAFRQLDQENPGRYETSLMYTEFEPCGNQTYPASANCSDYIAHELERPADQELKKYHEKTPEEKEAIPEQKNRIKVVYGAGYRLGALTPEEVARINQLPPEEREAEIDRARQQAVDARNADMHRFRGELARVWMKLAGDTGVA